MDERREPTPGQPCICGSRSHTPIRDQTFSASGPDVGFLHCPERPLPKHVTSGLAEVARGICWAVNPDTGLHCTEAPHGDDVQHRNAYAGGRWATEPAEPIRRPH